MTQKRACQECLLQDGTLSSAVSKPVSVSGTFHAGPKASQGVSWCQQRGIHPNSNSHSVAIDLPFSELGEDEEYVNFEKTNKLSAFPAPPSLCDGGSASSGQQQPAKELSRDLGKMVGNKDTVSFNNLGAEAGIASLLRTDLRRGLDPQDVENRRRLYGRNVMPQPSTVGFWGFFFETLEDRTVQILIFSALFSLLLGITTPDPVSGKIEPLSGCMEGIAIIGTVLIVAFVTAFSNSLKQKKFNDISVKSSDLHPLKVLRGGVIVECANEEVVVGDVVMIYSGINLTFDAILLGENNVRSGGASTNLDLPGEQICCDESNITGEAEHVCKSAESQPFLISGTNVVQGSDGEALVVAVGAQGFAGTIHEETEKLKHNDETPLQKKLSCLADVIGQFGLVAACITFVILVSKELLNVLFKGAPFAISKFLSCITIPVAIVVVAVPEGLPLAVTIALAWSMNAMLKDNNLVLHLSACETMGAARIICTDKTGTLTEQQLHVAKLLIEESLFNVQNDISSSYLPLASASREKNWRTAVSPESLNLMYEAIAFNTIDIMNPNMTHLALKALLPDSNTALKANGNINGQVPRNDLSFYTELVHSLPVEDKVRYSFNSTQKKCAVIIRRRSPEGAKTITCRYVIGAAETILRECASVIAAGGHRKSLTGEAREWYRNAIQRLMIEGHRTMCIAVEFGEGAASFEDMQREFNNSLQQNNQSVFSCRATLVGIVGIEEPVRSNVPAAVQQCTDAGIRVIALTGDSLCTTFNVVKRSCIIPTEYSFEYISLPYFSALPEPGFGRFVKIHYEQQSDMFFTDDRGKLPFTPAGLGQKMEVTSVSMNSFVSLGNDRLFIDGAHFRLLSDDDLVNYVLPRLAVLARATPLDKQRLVYLLRTRCGEVVAVTGDGTNDAPALKCADVGFAMNSGSDVAKRAADIVLLDSSFVGMVKATLWGRNVRCNIRKFLQFQMTVNTAACLLSVISAVMSDVNVSPLKPAQLLWINLIMDTLAALALSTGPPDEDLLKDAPEPPEAPIITSIMWYNILTQAGFQLLIQLITLAWADHWFSIPCLEQEHLTVVFNMFVLLQIFNFFNARVQHENQAFLNGIRRNPLMLQIIAGITVTQIVIVQYGGNLMSTTPLSIYQWIVCTILAALGLVVGYFIRRYEAYLTKSRNSWKSPKYVVRNIKDYDAIHRIFRWGKMRFQNKHQIDSII